MEQNQQLFSSIKPIGVIRSPHREPAGTPIQPAFAAKAVGEAVVDGEYASSLRDLDGFSRIWLIYWFHLAAPYKPLVIPFRDTIERGLFSTRAPTRPNPIGLSAVRLLGVEGNVLKLADIDIVDGTPLLDIKPYSPKFDCFPDERSGWLDKDARDAGTGDDRFA